jgi:hypothetical protein
MLVPPTTRRHHVVPKFLLSRFAQPPTAKGVLFALDKRTGAVQQASSNNLTIQKDYYVLPDDPELAGLKKDLPEQDLSRIEGAAAALTDELCQPVGLSWTLEQRATVALFVATMRARTPRERQQLASSSEHALNEVARALPKDTETIKRVLEEKGDPSSAADVQDFARRLTEAWARDEISITVPIDRNIGTLLRLAVEMASVIEQMSWWVLRASPSSTFVISDCPVAMYDVALREGRGNAFGSSPLAQTTLPLGPLACLELRPSGPPLATREASQEEVADINLRTYAWAERWVYGSRAALLDAHERAQAKPEDLARVSPRPYFEPPSR